MGPEGMQTSVVMANLVGSEKVPGELLWSAQASAAGLGLLSYPDPLPSLQGLQWEVSACSSQVLLAGAPCRETAAPGAYLELPRAGERKCGQEKEVELPDQGQRRPVPKKKRCSKSGMQMKGPRVIHCEGQMYKTTLSVLAVLTGPV